MKTNQKILIGVFFLMLGLLFGLTGGHLTTTGKTTGFLNLQRTSTLDECIINPEITNTAELLNCAGIENINTETTEIIEGYMWLLNKPENDLTYPTPFEEKIIENIKEELFEFL